MPLQRLLEVALIFSACPSFLAYRTVRLQDTPIYDVVVVGDHDDGYKPMLLPVDAWQKSGSASKLVDPAKAVKLVDPVDLVGSNILLRTTRFFFSYDHDFEPYQINMNQGSLGWAWEYGVARQARGGSTYGHTFANVIFEVRLRNISQTGLHPSFAEGYRGCTDGDDKLNPGTKDTFGAQLFANKWTPMTYVHFASLTNRTLLSELGGTQSPAHLDVMGWRVAATFGTVATGPFATRLDELGQEFEGSPLAKELRVQKALATVEWDESKDGVAPAERRCGDAAVNEWLCRRAPPGYFFKRVFSTLFASSAAAEQPAATGRARPAHRARVL